jgi:transcriptional regulator with XRE-family HTH domain
VETTSGFDKYLADLMRRRGLRQSQIASYAGVSHSTVINWLRGTQPTPESLRKLAQGLHIEYSELMRAAGHGEAGPEQATAAQGPLSPDIAVQQLVEIARAMVPERIPVQESWVHAGDVGPEGQFVYRQPEWHSRLVLIFDVHGDCMAPEVEPGDRVVVDLEETPQDGDLVVVNVDGEALCRLYDAKNQMLVAWNDYPPIPFSEGRQVGVIIEVNKRVRQRRGERRRLRSA